MKECCLKLFKKAKSWRYLVETITDVNYADDLVLLANTPAEAESQFYGQQQSSKGISLNVNSDKTEFTCLD